MRSPVVRDFSIARHDGPPARMTLRNTCPRNARTRCASQFARLSVALTVLTGLVGLTVSAAAAEPGKQTSAKPARTELSKSVDVPFDVTAGRPVIDARVNGAGPYRFAIETAQIGATLDDDVVRVQRLKPRGQSGGEEAASTPWRMPEVAWVELLDIRSASLADFDAAVREYNTLAIYQPPYDGTLGLSMFADFLLTIDYLRQRFTLKQTQLPPANGRDILDYEMRQGLPVISLLFGETSIGVTIDTSSVEAFVIAESLRGKIKSASNKSADKTAGTVDTEGKSEQTRMKGTVVLGGHLLVEPPVRFHGNRSVIGQLVLHYFSITFDQKNHRVRFTRRDRAPITFESPSKYGLVFQTVRGRMKVKDVIPGSPAARRGIVAGDPIVRINRWLASDYDAQELRTLMEESTDVVLLVKRDGFPLLVTLDAD